MSITFDYYSISVLIGGFTALLSGFVVYIHNHRTVENIAWFLFNISSAIWSFGYFVLITASSKEIAFYANWSLHIAAVLVPLFCLLSVVSITNTYIIHKRGVMIATFTGLLFLISTPSELLVRDLVPKGPFNYMVDVGPLYIAFTIYFFSLAVYVLSVLFKKYKECTNPIEINRYKYMMIFTAAGSIGGGSVFFTNFNIPILPYPLILFSLFPIISIYAIFRFQLFDVKVIATEFLVFSLWILIFIRTLLSGSAGEFLLNIVFLVLLVVAGIFLVRSVIKEVRLREELDISNTKLKEANQGQASLMHFMNHQIKGRLGTTKDIFAELLDGDFGVMPDESVPLLKKGLEEANIGVNYVQGILKGASAESGTLPYEMKEMDLKALAEEVVGKQREHAEKKELAFNFEAEDVDYRINGDVLQLGEALRNLIDNSINYTPKGSIKIHLFQKDSNIVFQITDTGVGLSTEDKLKLFKAGGRGTESLKVNVNATGYGLVFVKGVVESHKGRVWAESQGCGHGSTFYIELPKIQ